MKPTEVCVRLLLFKLEKKIICGKICKDKMPVSATKHPWIRTKMSMKKHGTSRTNKSIKRWKILLKVMENDADVGCMHNVGL